MFCAALQVGPAGRAVGVDFTPAQLAKANRLRERDGFAQASFVEARIDALPFDDGAFDAVISNGVINLSLSRAACSPRPRACCARVAGLRSRTSSAAAR